MNWRHSFQPALAQLVLLVWLLFTLLPVVIVIMLSLKPATESHSRSVFPSSLTLENYVFAWTEANFATLFLNSAIVTFVSMAIALAFGSLAAFAFARRAFFGMKVVFGFLIVAFFIPWHVAVIPLFVNLRSVGLLNSHFALILPYVAFTLPLAILIIRDFFAQVSGELESAALIDGCNDLQMLWLVFLPIARPALSAVAVLMFLAYWNEFILASTLVTDTSRSTVPSGILLFTGTQREFLGPVSAAVVISSIPVVAFYFFFQRTFVSGVTAGAVKE